VLLARGTRSGYSLGVLAPTILGYYDFRIVRSRTIHARTIHARTIHARTIHARTIHARTIHARTIQFPCCSILYNISHYKNKNEKQK